jgi:hypothetical protein
MGQSVRLPSGAATKQKPNTEKRKRKGKARKATKKTEPKTKTKPKNKTGEKKPKEDEKATKQSVGRRVERTQTFQHTIWHVQARVYTRKRAWYTTGGK